MTMITGKADIDSFRGLCALQALKLHVKTNGALRVTRSVTPTMLLKFATEYTGKTYKRGAHVEAMHDMQVWWDGIKAQREVV